MCLQINAKKWRDPAAQEGVFTPEGAPNFLGVEWDHNPSEGVGIINVTINGHSIMKHLRNSDIEALREEAAALVEGGVR